MSTSAIAASSTNIVSSVIGVERPLSRQPSGDGDSNPGSAPAQGSRLFTALFDALTQFVAQHQAAPAATTAAPAATTAAPAASPAATASTATSTPNPASTSSTNSSGSSSTPASSLGTDLQAFLHDLFSALRQAGGAREHAGHGSGRARDDWRADATPAVPVANAQQSASNGATSVASPVLNSAPPAAAAAPPAASTSAASAPATSSAAPVAATSPSSTAAYGRFGIVAELNALIKDLSNSQVVSATSSAAGAPANLSSSALANLNSAFSKLITDLGGTTSTASTPPSDTASLQAFLSTLLQDLQGSGAGNSLSPLGNGVNVSA